MPYERFLSLTKDDANVVRIRLTADGVAIDRHILSNLEAKLDEALLERELSGILIDAEHSFYCGPDFKEVFNLSSKNKLQSFVAQFQELLRRIEECRVPVVAVIRGPCTGVGFELALACHWRVAVDSPQVEFAMPYISNGLTSCGGSTFRLPRTIGIQGALDLLLSARKLSAIKAKALNLVDAVVPIEFVEEQAHFLAAKSRTQEQLERSRNQHLKEDLPRWAFEGNPLGRKVLQKKVKAKIEEKTKGLIPASNALLDIVLSSYSESRQTILEEEAKLFTQLAQTAQAKALHHIRQCFDSLPLHSES